MDGFTPCPAQCNRLGGSRHASIQISSASLKGSRGRDAGGKWPSATRLPWQQQAVVAERSRQTGRVVQLPWCATAPKAHRRIPRWGWSEGQRGVKCGADWRARRLGEQDSIGTHWQRRVTPGLYPGSRLFAGAGPCRHARYLPTRGAAAPSAARGFQTSTSLPWRWRRLSASLSRCWHVKSW